MTSGERSTYPLVLPMQDGWWRDDGGAAVVVVVEFAQPPWLAAARAGSQGLYSAAQAILHGHPARRTSRQVASYPRQHRLRKSTAVTSSKGKHLTGSRRVIRAR